MKRFSAGLGAPALLVVLAPVIGCIPNPDISGLPPYDGGFAEDSALPPVGDASIDVTLPTDGGTNETGPVDSGPQLGTVTGIVVDYTEGNGSGVVPGAVVSVSVPGNASATLPASVTTDANGLFTIPNVPAGVPLQIGASKPTDLTNGIAYSTTFLVTTVGAGQTVNVFPTLHEGCFQTVNVLAGADGGVSLQNANCGFGRSGLPTTRPGAYAAMTFDATSFKDSVTNTPYAGNVRIEMIPLAYPADPNNANAPDLSWAVGLPGIATPPGLLGAAEYRVVKSDPGQPDDGVPLAVNDNAVTIAVPVFAPPTVTPISYSYAASAGNWTAETNTPPSGGKDAGSPLEYVTIQVPHLSWWAATNGVASTTCVTGALRQGGAPAANVLVRAAGVNYLGSSTALTNSAGLFCLDGITSAVGGDGGALAVAAAATLSGGVVYAGAKGFGITNLTAGTCAAAAADASTSCISLAAIDLTPSTTCVSGSVTSAEIDGGVLMTLNATLDLGSQFLYAESAGIRSLAYVGEVTLGDGGAFCAIAPPGSNLELVDPASGCWAPQNSFIQVLIGSSALACGAAGCVDAGANAFGCPPLP